MNEDFAIEIKRAGQHPYMPGAARFSTWLAIAIWWFAGAGFSMKFIEPSADGVIGTIVILCLGTGALWGAGVLLARHNPFFQEVVLRFLLRSLRNRTNLET